MNILSDIPTSVTIGGKQYDLKPYSAPNERRLKDQAPKLEESLASGVITRTGYYRALLDLILKGGAPDIDYDGENFDGREVEAAFMLFLPPSIRAYSLLTGSLL